MGADKLLKIAKKFQNKLAQSWWQAYVKKIQNAVVQTVHNEIPHEADITPDEIVVGYQQTPEGYRDIVNISVPYVGDFPIKNQIYYAVERLTSSLNYPYELNIQFYSAR